MRHFVVSLVLALSGVFPAQATDYYVSTSGNNGNSCATATTTTQANNKRNIQNGVACLAAGDTLYIRGGTYTADYIRGADFVANGTNFGAGAITVSTYPGETVTLNAGIDDMIGFMYPGTPRSYIIIRGTDATTPNFIFDGINGTYGGGALTNIDLDHHHIRLENIQIKNAYGIGLSGHSEDVELLNVWMHGNGREPYASYTPGHPNLYCSGCHRWLVQGGRFYNNASGAIRLWASGHPTTESNDNVVDGAYICDNGPTIGLNGNSDLASGGGLMLGDKRNTVRNSIICRNYIAADLFFGHADATKLYNNTFYGNLDGIRCDEICVDVQIINNILDQAVEDLGTNTTQATNFTGDPSFVNAGASDFHIQTGSGAKTGGTNLSGSGVTIDFDGVARPQGATFSRGAYEFDVGGPETECSDGIDNDDDGLTDYSADPGCSDADDDDEYNAPPTDPRVRLGILRFSALDSFGLVWIVLRLRRKVRHG